MKPVQVILGGGATLVASLVLAAGSRATWAPPASEDGILRLTLSARPERIESCRRLSDAELARRPVHMRQDQECQGRSASYRLRVWRNRTLLEDEVLHGSGMRRDRPIHLLSEYAVPAGSHALRIEVRRVEPASRPSLADSMASITSPDRGMREAAERQRRRMEALPAMVVLEREVSIRSRAVTLVTWDPVARELRVISGVEEER